jgi:hypothetical protein
MKEKRTEGELAGGMSSSGLGEGTVFDDYFNSCKSVQPDEERRFSYMLCHGLLLGVFFTVFECACSTVERRRLVGCVDVAE